MVWVDVEAMMVEDRDTDERKKGESWMEVDEGEVKENRVASPDTTWRHTSIY